MTIKLEWIKELIDLIPETKITRKNIIAIAGYPKWENVNSNLLAFYFDENEEHKLGRLFINSLFDIIESKTVASLFNRENFETDFTIEREVSTLKGGRIDILIEGRELQDELEDEHANINEGWSIIIENKIFSLLYNDLSDYWKSIKSKNKFGIVLSINEIKIPEKQKNHFINITHKELIDKVKENLHEFYIEADDRHLLFLKEYFSNVYSFYKDDKHTKNMDFTLKLFQSKKNEIEEFKKVDLNLLRYISKIVFNVMTEMGFPQTSNKDTSKGKHFQINTDLDSLNDFFRENLEYAKKFRFWIDLSRLRYNNVFICYFELWGNTNTKFGDRLKHKLEELNIFNENIQKGRGGKSGSGYQHIYSITIPVDFSTEEEFGLVLKRELESKLFAPEKNFIELAISKLKEVIENQ